jgi:hypothetical protein
MDVQQLEIHFNMFPAGNGMLGKSWTSMTNGVVCRSGAKNIRQLQIKKVCLLKKMAERHCTANPLSRKCSFDTPEVPPPSRSPSKTNVIWVRVRNSSGNMEIDGFLRARKDFEELLPEEKDDKIPSKIEVRVPYVKDNEDNVITKENGTLKKTVEDLKLSTDTVSKQQYKEKNNVLEKQDNSGGGTVEKKRLQMDRFNLQASPSEQLAPVVKGLKVLPNKTGRSIHTKQNWMGRTNAAVYHFSQVGNERISADNENSNAIKEKIRTDTSDVNLDIEMKGGSDLKGENDLKNDRRDSGNDIVSNQSNTDGSGDKVGRARKKSGSVRRTIGSVRRKIGSARKGTRSKSGRKSIEKIDRKENANDRKENANDRKENGNDRKENGNDRKENANDRKENGNDRKENGNDRKENGNDRKENGNDRTNIGKDRSEQNTTSDEKNAKERKVKQHGQSSGGTTGKSYSKKIRKGNSLRTFVQSKPNVQGICIFAKTLKTGTTAEPKNNTGKKPTENKTSLPGKPRSTTRLSDRKSTTKLPRKSCSACTVKTSAENGREIGSKSDTAAYSKVRVAITSQQARSNARTPEKKTQLPVSITLPSEMQLQNFDKVAKIKLCKTLTVKMRKHYYGGTWAFPLAQGREMKGATLTS